MKKRSLMSVSLAALALAGCHWLDARRELTVAVGGLTPQEALEKIRAARAAGDTSSWTVRVKPGLHVLKTPLVFLPEDSGDVAWVGEGDGCVLAGGARIVGWKDEGNGVWSAALPKNPAGQPAFFEQLWVNGRRAERARLPSKGYWKAARGALEEDKANGRWIEKCFLSDADAKKLGEIPADELFYAQLCLIDKWTFARRILRGYDAAQKAAVCWSPCRWSNFCSWTGNDPVWFENVRSAFDAPGEWFYDAKNGRVLYRPLADEDMAKAEVIAPSSEITNLVIFQGDPDKGRYVEGLSFRGLTFACAGSSTIITDVVREATKGRYTPPKSGPTESWQYQAAQSADAAVMGFGARNISFERCAVRHTANYGMRFEDGCVSNRIVSCMLEDLGAGGVWMGARKMHVPPGEGDRLRRKEYRTIGPKSNAYNLISNCVIRTSGRFNPEGTGVALTHASDCRVVCNDIYDHYYTGVSVGFHWGYSGSVAQHNEIGFNRIYDLGKGIMSDMGGVYTLGTSFGTTVHDNVIHDVNSYSYGGWALYTDEGSEGIVMERNLCWNTTDGGFHQHYGVGCTIRNNIFAWNRLNAAVRSSRAECEGVKSTLNFKNNIILIDKANFVNGLSAIGGEVADNLWWSTAGSPRFDGKDWAGWVASGREKGGMLADPGFTDARHYDFTLKGDSPAFKLGFTPWDYARAGVRRVTSASAETVDVVVAPDGSDAAAGTFAHPVRTLERAQALARAAKAANPWTRVAVRLRGGEYRVSGTLWLGPEDAGTVWTAWKDERPVLTGGRRIGGWKPVAGRPGVFVADAKAAGYRGFEEILPTGYSTTHNVRGGESGHRVNTLYCDGRPLTVARHPNAGFFRMDAVIDKEKRIFRSKDVPGGFDLSKSAAPDLMAHGYFQWLWADEKLPVAVAADGAVKLVWDKKGYPLHGGYPFFLENAAAFVDQPGEWYLDRAKGLVYAMPPAGIDPAKAVWTLAEESSAFLVARGAKDVRLEGLVFEYGRGDAVRVEKSEGFVFAGNVIRNFGGVGLRVDGDGVTVRGNVLHTFGYDAMQLEGGDRRTLTPSRDTVAANAFSDTGRASRTYTPGILLRGCGTRLVGNWFHDIPSSAMRVEGNDHLILSNLVENVVKESDDQGGSDTWGDPTYGGILFKNNVWRNIRAHGIGSSMTAGIRFDDAISAMTVEGNRFENCCDGHFGSVQIHAGRFNTITNNLMVGGPGAVSVSDWDTWDKTRWRRYLTAPDGECAKQKYFTRIDINAPVWKARFPWLQHAADTVCTNTVVCNVVVGTKGGTVVMRQTGRTADVGNAVFAAMPSEAELRKVPGFTPPPTAGEVGPRPDDRDYARARANDSASPDD